MTLLRMRDNTLTNLNDGGSSCARVDGRSAILHTQQSVSMLVIRHVHIHTVVVVDFSSSSTEMLLTSDANYNPEYPRNPHPPLSTVQSHTHAIN